MKAMIFAAGLGSRLNELTKNTPKALVSLNGKPLLEHLILRLISFNIRDIIINVHHFADKIISFVESNDNFGIDITFSIENELLNTGGGIKKARGFFDSNEPFLVHNVDVICGVDYIDLLKKHKESGSLATLAIRKRPTSRFLLFDDQMILRGWESLQEKRKIIPIITNEVLTQFSFMGVQILNPEIFSFLPLEKKFSIIEAYLKIIKNSGKIMGKNYSSTYWFDLGTKQRIETAENFLTNSIKHF
jgi:NDP-sugar pyrophosphorylase family protein